MKNRSFTFLIIMALAILSACDSNIENDNYISGIWVTTYIKSYSDSDPHILEKSNDYNTCNVTIIHRNNDKEATIITQYSSLDEMLQKEKIVGIEFEYSGKCRNVRYYSNGDWIQTGDYQEYRISENTIYIIDNKEKERAWGVFSDKDKQIIMRNSVIYLDDTRLISEYKLVKIPYVHEVSAKYWNEHNN